MGSSMLPLRQDTFNLKPMKACKNEQLLCKISSRILVVCLFVLGTASCQKMQKYDPDSEVQVASYSTLSSVNGLLPWMKAEFEKQLPICKITLNVSPGATQLVADLEHNSKKVQVIVGLDEAIFKKNESIFLKQEVQSRWVELQQELKQENHSFKKELSFELPLGFLPLDYAPLTLIYDRQKMNELKLPVPQSLSELTEKKYRKTFIVQDPRMSSPGLVFFQSLPPKTPLHLLSDQWRALAQSWGTSYKMFLAGEAPMVWSYLSSMAYHASRAESQNYGWVKLKDGLPLQREGIAIVDTPKNNALFSDHKSCMSQWVHFFYHPSVQAQVYKKQFMFSVLEHIEMPKEFQDLEKERHFQILKNSPQQTDTFLKDFAKRLQPDTHD